MPELPEVETVKNTLKKHLLNRTIKNVEVIYQRMILTPLEEFIKIINNVTIVDIKRKGKYLIFILSNDYALISHLRMEGKYLYYHETDENPIHTRVVFHLDNDEKVIYDDSRCFGIMEIHPLDRYMYADCLNKLGPEPFDCDEFYLHDKIKQKKKEIKSTILDQTILSGLGNIYADETLFACKINPFSPSNTISIEDCRNIIINSRRILLKAIENGGSTVSSYHPENGVDGKFQNELLAYGKRGQKCPNCGRKMLKDFCNGRGTVYCPHCQHVAIRVGIYGKIASGKTTVSNYYKSIGYKVFSCDEYIDNLYRNSLEFKSHLVALFDEEILNDDGTISKGYIKNVIVNDLEQRKKLESYIHPLVKKGIEKFIGENKLEKIVFIEVPLLFETRCDKYMDYIIGVDASLDTQIQHLSARGSKNPLLDLKLNCSNKFDKYVHKCDYVIHNNDTLDYLKNECDAVIMKILNN